VTISQIKAEHRGGRLAKKDFIERMYQDAHSRLFDYAANLTEAGIEEIAIRPGEVLVTLKELGLRFRCKPGDLRQAPLEVFNFGALELEEASMISRLAGRDDVIFDIGANMGYYSILLSKRGLGRAIYAFEPVPETFEYLQHNIALNACTNIHARSFGLGDLAGRHTIYYREEESVNASLMNVAGHASIGSVEVEIRTLDELTREEKITPQLVKCDVEGAELLVIKGGLETLDRARPVLFLEMLRKWSAAFGYHPNQLIELLSAHGYRCFTARDGRLWPFSRMDDQTEETNFFFLDPVLHGPRLNELTR
jgi:FkbM family methyltransferase